MVNDKPQPLKVPSAKSTTTVLPLEPVSLEKDKKDNKDKDKQKVFVMLDSLIKRFLGMKNGESCEKIVKFEELRELCLRSRELILQEPPFLEVSPPVFVFGDIHGQLVDLQKMLGLCGPPPVHKFVFLGDYVDRGPHSIETVSLLLSYKLRYPKHTNLLRGNHETRCVNRQYGFYEECQKKYGDKGVELWTHYQHVFNCLPIAARIARRIFCAHGGISEQLMTFRQLDRIDRPTDICDIGLLCDLVWSDPSKETATYADSPRGLAKIFGKQACIDFCHQHSIDFICRAHQCVNDGYEFFADKRCVTIFSAPCYCGEVDNSAGVLHVSAELECHIFTFKQKQTTLSGCFDKSLEKIA